MGPLSQTQTGRPEGRPVVPLGGEVLLLRRAMRPSTLAPVSALRGHARAGGTPRLHDFWRPGATARSAAPGRRSDASRRRRRPGPALDARAALAQLALDARAGLLDVALEAVAGGDATALELLQLALGLRRRAQGRAARRRRRGRPGRRRRSQDGALDVAGLRGRYSARPDLVTRSRRVGDCAWPRPALGARGRAAWRRGVAGRAARLLPPWTARGRPSWRASNGEPSCCSAASASSALAGGRRDARGFLAEGSGCWSGGVVPVVSAMGVAPSGERVRT